MKNSQGPFHKLRRSRKSTKSPGPAGKVPVAGKTGTHPGDDFTVKAARKKIKFTVPE
jgi:hypothetical protein